MHPGALAGSRRRGLPLAEARRPGRTGGRAPRADDQQGDRRPAPPSPAPCAGSGPGAGFVARLDGVERRLAGHAATKPAAGLTQPDPPSGERWDWGQVWAHLGEFVPYWVGEVRMIMARPPAEDPVPFEIGRASC